MSSGKEQAVIRSKDSWIANDGAVICKDERTFRIYRPRSPAERLFDFEITIFANSDSDWCSETPKKARWQSVG